MSASISVRKTIENASSHESVKLLNAQYDKFDTIEKYLVSKSRLASYRLLGKVISNEIKSTIRDSLEPAYKLVDEQPDLDRFSKNPKTVSKAFPIKKTKGRICHEIGTPLLPNTLTVSIGSIIRYAELYIKLVLSGKSMYNANHSSNLVEWLVLVDFSTSITVLSYISGICLQDEPLAHVFGNNIVDESDEQLTYHKVVIPVMLEQAI